MAAATDELILLERVFIRLASADTDEQLQTAVCKFLPPVLLKLSSSQEGVRKKVMELLVHINKRIKSRPQVQLPVEALLLQYQDPAASSFVINFTIIYIKLGYPRMEMERQANLVPSVLNAIEGKPLSHQDSLLLIIMPVLGHIDIPMDPDKRASLLGLQDKPYVAKQLINFMLDVLLLPYGSVGQTETQQPGQAIDWSQFPVPPGLSEYAFKRVIGEKPPTAEQLEQTKLGIVKFLAGGFFPDSDILIHLIVAAADTRFNVANMADLELKKIVNTLNWSSKQLATPLYTLFLGTNPLKEVKLEMKRLPASTRIRLKLLHYLCRITKVDFIITPCIEVVFDSLYGKNTNPKLKSMALQFTLNIVQQCSLAPLACVDSLILNGMMQLISEFEDSHKIMAYTIIGQLGQRVPRLLRMNLNTLKNLFDALVSTEGDLQRAVRDALIAVTSAFALKKENETNIASMNDLLSPYIESPESNVRFVAMHYAANVFPPDDVPSRYLLLLSSGDSKDEISSEAVRILYGSVQRNESDAQENSQVVLPDFQKLVIYIYSKMQTRMPTSNTGKINIESKVLPFSVTVFSQIISYLRICLARSANVVTSHESLQHPCESTPLIARYLENLYRQQPEILNNYLDMILILSHVSADQCSLQALLEVVGSVPQYLTKLYEKETQEKWLQGLLKSTKPDIRQLAAQIYGAITAPLVDSAFWAEVRQLTTVTNEYEKKQKKNIEELHGAILAFTYMMERRLFSRKNSMDSFNIDLYTNIVKFTCILLHDNSRLLMEVAIESIGILGKTYSLPLPDAGDEPNKKTIVETLFSVQTDAKLNTKIKEKAAISLGYLCLGENFPYTADVVTKIITTVKETKDVEVHLTLGEALVCCVQGQAHVQTRNAWETLPSEHKIPLSNTSTELLMHTVDELLKIHREPHPNLRQAVCVWLLALLKYNIHEECIKERFSLLHHAFIDFLSDDSNIVQDIAAKALSLIHINSSKEEKEVLVSNILDQFIRGRKAVKQVTADTKLFEEGQLGKSPTSGNLSTYKEICSLATELQKPDLIYYFMHLANHNAVWNSKKGAAFGFAAIAKMGSEELNKYLPSIIPRLYRYQFDPTPKIQQSMSNIWRIIVPSTNKAIEQYHNEILKDITDNLTHHEWRVRISSCNALADLLRANVRFNVAECAPDLWKKLFRVMDDIHEGTRLAATSTTKIFSKICIRYCDSTNGKEGEETIQAILPVLLDIGITNVLDTVRSVSLHTVSQLVTKAGPLLKPSLVTLIPAILSSIGESENPSLSYLSIRHGSSSETQETIDSIRASAAKGHSATDTLTKCVQYVDAEILKALISKVVDLMKSSVGFGTKIACSHFIILLCTYHKMELQPYAGKVLSALLNGLSDRNSIVRKNNAIAIGHIVVSVKESSLDKLFKTLYTWYIEKDDSTKISVGQTLQAINNYNQDVLKKYSNIVMPLTFFAMHMQKTQENENMVNLWTDLWNEITPGTEAGIMQNLETITELLQSSLESQSWTAKAQAANAVDTLAQKLGNRLDPTVRNTLLKVLTDGLRGRTWDGKERVLNALATLSCNSKQALKEDPDMCAVIVETLHRESKKEAFVYRRHALQAFGTVLHELDIDKFQEISNIFEEIWRLVQNKSDNETLLSDERTKRNEDILKLHETVYGALGKAWPTCKETQDKYCIEIVTRFEKVFPTQSTIIQVSMLTSLTLFVTKLALLKLDSAELSMKDKEMLHEICDKLNKILGYSIGISYTRIRSESLDIALSLGTKLRDTKNIEHFHKTIAVLKEFLPQLAKDNEPEILTRLMNIKQTFKL
ncbi:proteasome adapter and scaffold protein ECM29 [Lasioglossum baleicum]|uniref:proteasome adapter and scaffold protein ECM29 n=1 Tax=Lasioglossum baleicum TaxID=434251 RepID=UPI003FCD004C